MTEITDDDTRSIVSRLAQIAAEKADLDAEEKQLKQTLRGTYEVGTKLTFNGTPVLAIQPYRRFSTEIAAQNLTPELLALCTVPVVDPKRAKDVLPPAVYSTCCKEYEPRVVLL